MRGRIRASGEGNSGAGVVGFGGLGTVPAAIAAWIERAIAGTDEIDPTAVRFGNVEEQYEG